MTGAPAPDRQLKHVFPPSLCRILARHEITTDATDGYSANGSTERKIHPEDDLYSHGDATSAQPFS